MPYYYAEPTGALLQHSNKAFKFKQRPDFKRYTFLRNRGFSIVIRHSLPTKASFQKVYFFLGHPVYPAKEQKKPTQLLNKRGLNPSLSLTTVQLDLRIFWRTLSNHRTSLSVTYDVV